MPEAMNPAQTVVHLFGGRQKVAHALGIDPVSVWRWLDRDDGLIPSHHHKPLLAAAKERKIKLTPSHLVLGRK